MEVSDMDDEEEDDLSLGTEDSFSDESAEDGEDEDLDTSIGLAYLQTSNVNVSYSVKNEINSYF
jgi:hypothetical protein